MNNSKKYNAYNSANTNTEDEDIISELANYPQDSYFKPSDNKVVGKLDAYSKEKENFNNKKSRVILKDSKIASDMQDKKLDDLVPSDLGNAIDNVFSKVDGLLNATGKLFFGSAKKAIKATPKPKPQPVPQARPVAQTPQPIPSPVTQVKAQPQVQQPQPKPVVQTPVPTPVAKSSIVTKTTKPKIDDDFDNTPPVTKSTMISDLDLPMELLSDPDLVRYFDQMKLFDKKVTGGLGNKTFRQATEILKKGRWGKLFMISYDKLKINTMMSAPETGLNRFNGMSPVYKAMGRNFTNTEELKKAIEKDINSYLKTGEGSGDFHKFTYKITRK